MFSRKPLILVGLMAAIVATLVLPGVGADAQDDKQTHTWFFTQRWTENADGPTIAHRLNGVRSSSLDAILTSYNGGTVGLIPKATQARPGFGAAFPKLVANLDACEEPPVSEPWLCEQANFKIVDDDGVLNPDERSFWIRAEIRLTPDEVSDQAGVGLNIFQRGRANDDSGQYKLQLDGGIPSCRWSDGDNQILLKGKTNLSKDERAGEWAVVECRKFGTGDAARYKLFVDGTLDARCDEDNSLDCEGTGGFSELGKINPTGDVYIGGVPRPRDNPVWVGDQFTGDLGFVQMQIG